MRALVAAAAVIGTSVTFAMFVVVAEEVQPHFEFAGKIIFCRSAGIAGGSAHNFDIGLFQGIDGTAADAAANKHIYILCCQQRSQCAMTGVAAL